jgi:hypothetical protein
MQRQEHRETVLYALEKLADAPHLVDGPMFAFVHILAPHDPYVFGPGGEAVDYRDPLSQEDEKIAYRGQVEYLNGQVLPAIRRILAESETPPVIVLMGDHGAGLSSEQGRMAIFDALYLPGDSSQPESFYETITPVNTFRVVFNEIFGGSFDLLPDRSFFSIYDTPYNFHEVPGGCP